MIVEGNKKAINYDGLNIFEHVKLYVNDGMNEKEAIKLVAKERNIAKSEVYMEYHNNK